MARKKQQLINYHTSTVAMPQAVDVQLGELVVRHATDRPELLIKKDNNEFATFVDSGKVQSMITTSSTDLQGKIDAISDNLRDNYADSASTVAAIKAVDDKLTKDYATSAATVAAIKVVDDKLTNDYATSADTHAAIKAVDTKLDNAVSSLTDTINTKISSAYIYKGSCTYAELSGKEKVVGYVYNVTDAHDNVPAGTNYAWDGESWDALAGIVDLTIYATSADTHAAIKAVDTKLTTYYATSADTETAIKAVDTKLTRDYATSAATVAAIKVVDDKFGGYATSADTEAAISAVQGNVDTLKNSVTGLSASTVSIEATANSAIQNASIVDGNTCKVSVKKEGTELQFDFKNLVIDCGDF